MSETYILLLTFICAVGLVVPISATQYNPPWSHNYGFSYPDADTRSYATYAAGKQTSDGYNAFNLPNSGAYISWNNLKDDAVFCFEGHGVIVDGEPGGSIRFYNGTNSFINAEYLNYLLLDQGRIANQYFLSSLSNEIQDSLLVVYVSCYSGKTSSKLGNLVEMSNTKGVDNTIGFSGALLYPYAYYWSDRFWYRCLYGFFGSHQTIRNAASGAVGDVMIAYGNPYGTQYMYARYRSPYNDYLDPSRYGII